MAAIAAPARARHAAADGAQAGAVRRRRAAGFEGHLRATATLGQVWRTMDAGLLLQVVPRVPRRVHGVTSARADAAPNLNVR